MTTITTPHSREEIRYQGWTIEVCVGFGDDGASTQLEATANIYKNETCAGRPFHHISAQPAHSVDEMVRTVCERAKAYVDTWQADCEDIQDQMNDAINAVFTDPVTESAIEKVVE